MNRDLESAELFDDTLATLTELRAMDLKLGLISNLAGPYKFAFDRLGLAKFFDRRLFSCDFGACKPDPRLYSTMATDLTLAPDQLLMVGDRRRADYDGPRAAGLNAILLNRGGTGSPSAESDAIASLRQVPDFLRAGRT